MKLDPKLIHSIVTSFYEEATRDVLIGFHFKHIKDFSEHIPRICAFWEFQFNGQTSLKLDHPFDLLNAHAPLKFTMGQLNRWVFLFDKTLDDFVDTNQITESDKEEWMVKVHFFKQRLQTVAV